jgi:hypothetical protein
LPAISSTDVRAKVAAEKWDELAQLVPRGVLSLIRARRLYALPSSAPEAQPK